MMTVTSSVPGHNYTLQYCPNLSGSWTDVGSVAPGTGGAIQFPPIAVTGTMGFWRIMIQRQ